MDAITAVSRSGPAYFALLAESMIEAGILPGFAARSRPPRGPDDARDGEAPARREDAPVELREMVTSPGGTTIAPSASSSSAGVRAAFLNAIQAAMERSRELAKGR